MARAIELVGDRLLALPDGEIGERSDQYPSGDRSQWVAGLAGRLAREPSLFDVLDAGTMNEQGFPVDFDSTARLRPRLGRTELGERLRLGYDTAALRIPRLAAGLAAKPIVDLVRRLPSQAPVGLHLCYGDLNNIALIAPQNFDRLVGFANALIHRWPKSHTLAYVHLPFAAGASPPPTDPGAYRALRSLNLPAGASLVAGLVHERLSPDSLRGLLRTIERARGGEVDIACAFEEGPQAVAEGHIVCHGDIAPRNTVLREGQAVALISARG